MYLFIINYNYNNNIVRRVKSCKRYNKLIYSKKKVNIPNDLDYDRIKIIIKIELN